MTSVLLYHVYPINHWKEVTSYLFQKLPFDKVIVHVSLPNENKETKEELEVYFKQHGIAEIIYSENSGKGEVDAMKSFVSRQKLEGFDMLTYMHCKGVTKPENQHIAAWTKLMRYFIIEKMDTCQKVFRKGYVTFGINKSVPDQKDEGFRGCRFFYEGNFVSLNLNKVDLVRAVKEHLEDSYYGLEGFWGKLCSYREGYSIFDSGINHYLMSVAEKDYVRPLARLRYNIIKNFYNLKSRL